MNITEINSIFYSPTFTTKNIVTSIANFIDKEINNQIALISHKTSLDITNNSLNIIGTPVYGGRVPLEAIEKLNKINGNNQLAVVTVVYGNRDFDDALLELKDIAIKQGFRVIAAGAFIGEHSLFTPEKYIAKDRPDRNDMEIIENFAKDIISKINNNDFSQPAISGNFPYKERGKKPPLSPNTDEEFCTKCGACLESCPIDAISIDDITITNSEECLWCNACVRICPTGARVMSDPLLISKVDALYEKCQERKEPQLFL